MDVSVYGEVIITNLAIIVIPPNPTKDRTMRTGSKFAFGVAGSKLTDRSGAPASGGLLNLSHGDPVPPLEQMNSVMTCWPSDVPAELSGHSNWPKLKETTPLTIYPRSVIDNVRLSWTGKMTITVPGVYDGEAGVNFWQLSKAKKHLRRAGFPMK